MTSQDAVSLTKALLRFDTTNPPGRESDCARYAGAMLREWGYAVEYFDYQHGRTSVVARAGVSDNKGPLCLTGHLDVVPLGAREWTHDPFAGETDGDRLYGRGASDMKAGVAAILLAARAFAGKLSGTPGVVVVLTAAEEGGCIGSALKWFQDRRGFAAGVIAAGFGGGTALFIPIISSLIANQGYRAAFFWTGLAQGLVIFIVAQFLRHPAHGAAAQERSGHAEVAELEEKTRRALSSAEDWKTKHAEHRRQHGHGQRARPIPPARLQEDLGPRARGGHHPLRPGRQRARPSGPGVEVTKPCAGGAAIAEFAGKAKPITRMAKKKIIMKRALRIFIGGDYIR